MKSRLLTLLLLLATLLFVSPLAASMSTDKTKPIEIIKDDPVITIISPSASPLEILTSPKSPRQPVPASDGSDYLKTLPGFSQIRNGGTNGDPVFRGMFGSRLRILTNSGEMPGACPSRMDAPTSYISPENYDVLSIIKGPQTVLWGPGNSAGTLRFDREPPQFAQAGVDGSLGLLTASNRRTDTLGDISVGNETGYLRITGNRLRAEDYHDGNGMRVSSRWRKWNSDLALGLTPDSDTLLEITAGRGNGEARYAGRSMDGAQFKRDSLGLRIEKSNIGETLDKLEASVYRNHADHIMDNYSLRPFSLHSAMPADMPMKMKMQLDRTTYGGRMAAQWRLPNLHIQSGADFQTSYPRSKKTAGWQRDARFHDVGIFSELIWNANSANKLIGGARLDKAGVNNGTARGANERSSVLPAGFIRLEHTAENLPLMLYSGVGYTTRFPDYWELFSPTYGADGHSSAFDTVKTEKTTQWDVGAIYSGEKVNGWMSAYLGQVEDFILFDYDANNPRLSRVASADARIAGAEAGLSITLTQTLSTDISLAYALGENTTAHRPLPQIPPFEARVGLNWQHKKWSAGGLLRMVSSQNRVALNEGNVVGKDFDQSAGFYIVSMNAAYQFNEDTQLSLGVDNLFNRAYSEHLNLAGNSALGYSAFTPVNEPGRTAWARLRLDF